MGDEYLAQLLIIMVSFVLNFLIGLRLKVFIILASSSVADKN